MSVLAPTVLSKTANFTASWNDLVLVDATAGAVTITLPAATPGHAAVRVKKVDASANAVTVQRAGSATIDGANSVALADQYDAVEVVADGTNWHVIARVG